MVQFSTDSGLGGAELPAAVAATEALERFFGRVAATPSLLEPLAEEEEEGFARFLEDAVFALGRARLLEGAALALGSAEAVVLRLATLRLTTGLVAGSAGAFPSLARVSNGGGGRERLRGDTTAVLELRILAGEIPGLASFSSVFSDFPLPGVLTRGGDSTWTGDCGASLPDEDATEAEFSLRRASRREDRRMCGWLILSST